MKKNCFAVIVMVCLAPVTLALGQGYSVGGFASYNLPVAPEFFKDYWKGGIGFGAEFKMDMSTSSAIVGTFHMLNCALNSDKFIDDVGMGGMGLEVEGGNIKGFAITANYMKYLTQRNGGAGFYVTAGGGYYSLKPDDLTVKFQGQTMTQELSDEADTGFGINGGLGVEFGSGSFSFFVEGRYHHTFIDTDDAFEDGDGGNISLITIKGGVRIHL